MVRGSGLGGAGVRRSSDAGALISLEPDVTARASASPHEMRPLW